MPHLVAGVSKPFEDTALANMFRERKRVFIDLLGWDIPPLADAFEVDQFDGVETTYLVLARADGTHLGSMRLLPSVGPNILGTIFPFLCDGDPPDDPRIWEISRFCLSRDLRAAERRVVRNHLISTAVRFALDNDIEAFCCVADMGWLRQIPSFGWQCRPLGLPRQLDCGMTGALRIDIGQDTPRLMAEAGTWLPFTGDLGGLPLRAGERDHAVH